MTPDIQTVDQAIQYLRQNHAKSDAVEAAFAFDASTGALLDFATGDEESVDLDEEKLSAHANVILLHSHPVNAAATAHDWQHFIECDYLRQFIIVGPTSTYEIDKPEEWQPNSQWRKNPHEDWEDYCISVSHERGFSINHPPSSREWEECTCEANKRMAAQYGLNFWWQREGAL